VEVFDPASTRDFDVIIWRANIYKFTSYTAENVWLLNYKVETVNIVPGFIYILQICFVFIVERCPLLLCFVYCVLFECVVTLCMCYLSVVFYCCTTATGLKPNCS
jgi:hypothetical protein